MNNKEGTHATKMALRRSNGGELADMSKEKPGGKEDGRPLEFADHQPTPMDGPSSTRIDTTDTNEAATQAPRTAAKLIIHVIDQI